MNDPLTQTTLNRRDARLIGVSGEDAVGFLQGQLTVDCAAIAVGSGRLGALCTSDGRVDMLLRVLRLEQGFALAVPDPLADALTAHLLRHRFRARVQIDSIDESAHLRALRGEPPRALASLQHPGGLVEVLLAGARSPQVPADGMADWYAAAVAHGLAEVLPATRERFLPQWLNLDLLAGISFTKGCYLGQEIVARMHHRGRITRRMLRLACTGPPLPPGAPLHAGAEQIGDVVLSGPAESGAELLAVVRVEHLARLGQAGFERRPLPYSVPEAP